MQPAEKRKFIRQDSLHLLDYLVIDKEGKTGNYSMGRTLDVSINGIQMETIYEIPADSTLVITLGIEDNLMDISGTLTYCKPHDGRYASGIEFIKVDKKGRRILQHYVEIFQARKHELLARNDFPG